MGRLFTGNCGGKGRLVSIQLVSPASGEDRYTFAQPLSIFLKVSIQLVSPASGEQLTELDKLFKGIEFPFN